jgi:hypothetical protein
MLLVAVAGLGCNGGSSKGGKSLNQQYQEALKIADAGQRPASWRNSPRSSKPPAT